MEALKDAAYYTGRSVPDVLEEAIKLLLKAEQRQSIQCYDPETRTAFLKGEGQEYPSRTHDLPKGRPLGT